MLHFHSDKKSQRTYNGPTVEWIEVLSEHFFRSIRNNWYPQTTSRRKLSTVPERCHDEKRIKSTNEKTLNWNELVLFYTFLSNRLTLCFLRTFDGNHFTRHWQRWLLALIQHACNTVLCFMPENDFIMQPVVRHYQSNSSAALFNA